MPAVCSSLPPSAWMFPSTSKTWIGPKVKQAGAEFVMIRIGYRGYGSGALVLDPMFEQHFTNARNAGLRSGCLLLHPGGQ